MKRNNIRIAIQKQGRLKTPSLKYLDSLGLKFLEKNGKKLIVSCQNTNVEILYVRHSDIPQYVQDGAADFGIVGSNVLYEKDFNIKTIKKLDFGKCSLVIAVPFMSKIKKIQDLEGERIATSYPNSLRKFLSKQKISAVIIEIKGSVEIAPTLGLADAICDLTQTGNSLRENNLKPIATLFNSTALFIESPFKTIQKSEFKKKFLTKLL